MTRLLPSRVGMSVGFPHDEIGDRNRRHEDDLQILLHRMEFLLLDNKETGADEQGSRTWGSPENPGRTSPRRRDEDRVRPRDEDLFYELDVQLLMLLELLSLYTSPLIPTRDGSSRDTTAPMTRGDERRLPPRRNGRHEDDLQILHRMKFLLLDNKETI